MTAQELKRKLTAILNADVKGYSRLMGEDEKGTVRTLNAYKEVMTGLIQRHSGRLVDAPGDNVLAEFASVVDAVECAVEIQKELKTRNAELPENRRMEFRIGVNLGDVIEEGERIYGDGLNISARLESLAEPGGICISGTAFDQVKNKLNLGYKYLGEQTVKNISEPVRVYHVLMEPEAAGKVLGEKKLKPRQRKAAYVVGSVLIVLIAAIAIWGLYFRTPLETASKEKMAYPLPDKPSIAVLPFVNMSEDPKQEFFSDGITEEVITALSKLPSLFVIARNSTFAYKGKSVKVQQVSEELGIRYVLEGSVRKDGNNIRITAQLIDALTGNHLWAERYDRDLRDVFAVQDEITNKIVTAMQVKLTEGEQVQAAAKGTHNLEAYLKYLQARVLLERLNPENNALAKQLAEEAVALDPKYGWAYFSLGKSYLEEYWLGTSKSPNDSLASGIESLQKAILLDDNCDGAHALLGWTYSMRGQYDKAIVEGEKAIALNPNSAYSRMLFGKILTWAGRYEESIPELKTAIRLNPIPPNLYLYSLGISYALMGQNKEAITWYEKAVRREPNSLTAHLFMASAYSQAGRDEEARAEAAEVLRIKPAFSLERFLKSMTYKNQDDVERTFSAPLRKTGLK